MNEIIENLIDASTLNDAASMISPVINEESSDFVSKSLTDYVTTNIDAPHNNDVVKIMAAAMQIASEGGILETPATSPLQTAVTAVNIAQNLNLSYLIEKGEIQADQAANMLIDQATANASVIAEQILRPETLKVGMDSALDAVGAFWPPIMPATQFAKQFTGPVASFVSDKVKPIVRRGIQTVSNHVKTFAHNVIHRVAGSVKTKVKSYGEKLLSVFS